MFYLYTRENDWYNSLNIIKIGIFGNELLKSRENVYLTGEPIAGNFTSVWECNLSREYDKYLKLKLNKWNYNGNGGTEFFENTNELHMELSNLLEAQGDLIRKLKQEEIDQISRKHYESMLNEKVGKVSNREVISMFESENETIIDTVSSSSEDDSVDSGISPRELLSKRIELSRISRLPESVREKAVTTFLMRDYQREIIDKLVETLQSPIPRIYLELATGAGKSCITFNVVKRINPDVLFAMSPRKNINKQNMSSKYLSILGNEYLPYNFSEPTEDFGCFKKKCEESGKKMLIVGTSQGANKKIYDTIVENDLKNVFVWFDEAHHTVESWIKKVEDECKVSTKFLLEDTSHISYRLFTSASPDKNHVSSYPGIFGELYSPITVKELISRKWLCPIRPHIYDTDKDEVNVLMYNINHFCKYNCRFGFSFHNNRESAYNLFSKHVKLYVNKSTQVKPYLLVGKDYKNSGMESIVLDYNFRNVESFQDNENSIGYVVQMYSMGYDFYGVDYVMFSDPKMSYSDIIQCIGRGMRPDGLGANRTNLNKELSIMLPIYIDSVIDTDFNRIEGVLRYLVYDIDYPFEDIVKDFTNNDDDKKLIGTKYEGNEHIGAVLLDLLRGGKYSTWKSKDFIKWLTNNNIHNRESYNSFIERRPELNLPEDPFRCFSDFTWEQTFDKSPYYSKEECKQKIAEIKENDEDLDLDSIYEPEVYLNSIDPKIPPNCLFTFYGGYSNSEYY